MTAMAYGYDFTTDAQPVELDPFFFMDGRRLSRAFCQALPVNLADLLDVVMAVYAADRRSPRDFRRTATGQRSIRVRVGVRSPDLWASAGMTHKLEELLYWLSEDEWTFEFERRHATPTSAESEGFLFPLPPEPPATVSLFSGGLDSLAGLVAHAQEGSSGSDVLVSGYTHNRLAYQQRLQVDSLRSVRRLGSLPHAPTEIRHVAVPFGTRKPLGHREEKGQRTRALVFLALGVATAFQAGTDTLWIHENGIGALNLPLNETQLGTDNYKGVHPRSLMMVQNYFSLALGQSVRLRNPFLFSTKGQMCKSLVGSGFAEVVSHTISCDGFPQRLRNQPSQCGHCTSCILRRQSLQASGLEQFDRGYRYDVLRPQKRLPGKHLYDLEAMRGQVYKIGQCLASKDPWGSLCASFPELARTHAELIEHLDMGSHSEVSRRLVDLYRAYVWEWERFIEEPRRAA